MKKINFENTTIIGCIPVAFSPEPPKDQKACILEKCPICDKNMWISEKKRQYIEGKSNVIAYCFICIQLSSIFQNVEIVTYDLNKMN